MQNQIHTVHHRNCQAGITNNSQQNQSRHIGLFDNTDKRETEKETDSEGAGK